MTIIKGVSAGVLAVSLLGLTGCFGGFGGFGGIGGKKSVKTVKPEPNICELLQREKTWIQPALKSEQRYGTPLALTFVLLEQPLTQLKKTHIKPRAADWDEYRIRSERWDASPNNAADAVDFIGWFTQESVKRNNITLNDVSAHYLALRVGHGNYHRLQADKYPELLQQAEQIERKAQQWQSELALCRDHWHKEGWYQKLKFW